MKTEIEHCKHFDIIKDEKNEDTCVRAREAMEQSIDKFCHRCHIGCIKTGNNDKLHDCYED